MESKLGYIKELITDGMFPIDEPITDTLMSAFSYCCSLGDD